MDYLKTRDEQGKLKRASLQSAVPWARSVIVCGINYNTAQPYSTEVAHNKTRGWLARYAWSAEDYHDSLLRQLRQGGEALRYADENPRPRKNSTRCDRATRALRRRRYPND